MKDAEIVYEYERSRREATKLKLNLTTIESPIDGYKYFAIGPRRYDTFKKIQEQITDHYGCYQHKCPIKTFKSLVTVKAFLIGFAVASKQPVPFDM